MATDLLIALDAAGDAFRRALLAVPDDGWTAPTPCTDWDVHMLVAHVVGGNRFGALVLDGATTEEAMAAVMGARQLGDDPARDLDESMRDQRALFARTTGTDAVVSHPAGALPVDRFLGMRVYDVALHAWDLATAVGVDPGLGAELVDAALGVVRREVDMGFGIEPCGAVDADAAPLDLLLDLSGRCVDGPLVEPADA